MYFCTVNGNSSRTMILHITVAPIDSRLHSFQPCGALSRLGQIEINAPINTIIIIINNNNNLALSGATRNKQEHQELVGTSGSVRTLSSLPPGFGLRGEHPGSARAI